MLFDQTAPPAELRRAAHSIHGFEGARFPERLVRRLYLASLPRHLAVNTLVQACPAQQQNGPGDGHSLPLRSPYQQKAFAVFATGVVNKWSSSCTAAGTIPSKRELASSP
jgi:hypothetical protein